MSDQQLGSAQHAAGTRNRTVPSRRAPSLDPVFRRPSNDPTLGDGAKAPTSPAWAHTPTRTERSAFAAPGIVVGTEDSTGGAVAAALEQLDRRVELVAPGTPGVPVAAAGGGVEPRYPLMVFIGSADAVVEPAARTAARTVAAYRPGATVVYDVGAHPQTMGSADDVREQVEAQVATADVVLLTTEDLDWLYPGEDPRSVVRQWLASGPGIAVVSAPEGVSAVNSVGVSATAPAVDHTGRPAFVAAVIDALWKGGLLGVAARPDLRTLVSWSLQELVDHGSAAARLSAGGGALSREALSQARGVPQLTAAPTAG